MSTRSIEERIKFVQSIKIGRSRASLAVAASKASASVDAGSLVSFVANVSGQHRSDALSSTLLAQLHADARFDRFDKSQFGNWYKDYTSTLGIVGWTMPALQFQSYQPPGPSFSIDAAIAATFGVFLPPAEFAVVKASLDALGNLGGGDPVYTLWDQHSHDGNGGNFQLASCSDTNGAADSLVLRMSGYCFNTTQTTTRFLWTTYSSATTDLSYCTETATLDDSVYSALRSQIISKLGAQASACIGDLSI